MVKSLFPEQSGFKVGCPLSFRPFVDAASYCLSAWVDNSSVMNWATLTIWASPLSLAVRCGCGLLQSVEILSVCTANQRSACSRDVVLLSRQPPTFLSEFWSSLVSTPCLFISLSPFCMCFYQRCVFLLFFLFFFFFSAVFFFSFLILPWSYSDYFYSNTATQSHSWLKCSRWNWPKVETSSLKWPQLDFYWLHTAF